MTAAGLTFGIFTTAGGLLGAGWAAFGGGKRLARAKVVGLNLGGQQIRIGPVENIQFIYILLDRGLIFYSHIINWAHGRRDYPIEESSAAKGAVKAGFTFEWDDKKKGICQSFYTAIRSDDGWKKPLSRKALKEMLQEILLSISQSNRVYGVVDKS